MRPGVPDVHITDGQDAVLSEYRAISPLAVAAMLVGLLAPVALIDPALWCVPVLGAVLGWLALRHLRAGGLEVGGRKMALWGLFLSLLFCAAAPTQWLAYRYQISQEAKQFANQWFGYVLHEEPHKAMQLTVSPQLRQALNDRLWDYYRINPKLHWALDNYVASSPVRTLLALGPKALVRFYEISEIACGGKSDDVTLWYAVTFEEGNEKKSFFIRINVSRTLLRSGQSGWRVARVDGGLRPDAWTDGK